jgi:filamentous hemagglutinin
MLLLEKRLFSIDSKSINHKSNVLILSGLIFFMGQAAEAARGDRTNFQEFRLQNAGIDRHLARALYKEQRQNNRHNNLIDDTAALHGIAGSTTRVEHLHRIDGVSNNVTLSPRHNNPSFQINEQGRMLRLSTGINLDLSSQDKNIVLGQKLFSKVESVEIIVGGERKTVSAGAQVTASEYVAVKQVMEGLGQSVVLNGNGQATSGDINLSALTEKRDVMRAANLVVPVQVTALADFSKGSDFRLLGDLDNFGTVEALAGNSRRSATIRAEDINNHSGAAITSTGDLTLSASGILTNDGTITSTQNLNLEASALKNTGNVSAAKNITITAPQTSLNQALTINNTSGTLNASGDINIRTETYQGAADTNLFGGNIFCNNLNLHSGNGTVNVNVNELNGTVQSKGTAAHVTASTDVLTLGNICLTGDPTFYNTAGSINIDGNITVAEALTIIANGSVNFNNGSDLIAANNTQGFPITVVAGASFVPTGGTNQGTIGPIPPNNPNAGSVLINGGSTTGGAINFNSSSGIDTFISTRPTGGAGNAGDVTLAAFAGANAGSGRINTGLPTFDRIFAGGKSNGNNGSVTIIAPSLNNGATFLPAIDISGGNGTPGAITVAAADPIANNVVYGSNGNLVAGQIVPSSSSATNGEVRFASVNAGKGTLTARGFFIQLSGNTPVTARKIVLDSTGAISLFSNITATSLVQASAFGQIISNNGISTVGQINSPLTVLTSTNNSIGTPSLPIVLQSGGTLIADGALGVNASSPIGINIGGGSTKTGDFVIAAGGDTSITGDIGLGVGNIDISTTNGQITAGAVSLATSTGNISIAALGADKKTTKLTLTGTQITALGSPGLGDITLAVGQIGSPFAGKAPKKNISLTTTGGQIFFGQKGITALGPTNFMTAKNADIIFNNPYNKKNIVVSGVNLIADP